jgi:alkanesulfonate monooxygenase SsuD/methylene tetrahydromethanopterin reductase-like flavin-dependent oxidoreductase (luciferase family)
MEEGARFISEYYGTSFPRRATEAWTAAGSAEDCAEQLLEVMDEGPTRLVLRLTSWQQEQQYDRLMGEVLPILAREVASRSSGASERVLG